MMTGHPRLTWVDAFTDRAFAGNPAAVCLFPDGDGEAAAGGAGGGWPFSDTTMQDLARELGLSETAFLRRRDAAGTDWDLRWFTPAAEVALCGHATLASAHVLWHSGRAPAGEEIHFHTLSGKLTASRPADRSAGDGGGGERDEDGAAWTELDFPAQPAAEAEAPRGLLAALGAEAEWAGTNGTDWLVEVRDEATVRSAEPDLAALGRVPARGVILTSAAADPAAGYEFVSRFFAPAVGVPEDPVTGSAHCCLAPHWAARLGRRSLTGYQASARGGFVRVRLDGDRVRLGGQAVTVLSGELAERAGAG